MPCEHDSPGGAGQAVVSAATCWGPGPHLGMIQGLALGCSSTQSGVELRVTACIMYSSLPVVCSSPMIQLELDVQVVAHEVQVELLSPSSTSSSGH